MYAYLTNEHIDRDRHKEAKIADELDDLNLGDVLANPLADAEVRCSVVRVHNDMHASVGDGASPVL